MGVESWLRHVRGGEPDCTSRDSEGDEERESPVSIQGGSDEYIMNREIWPSASQKASLPSP